MMGTNFLMKDISACQAPYKFPSARSKFNLISKSSLEQYA